MTTVRSKDGTTIAFERTGSGPPLILIDGALCWRESGPARKVAAVLADRFTVITYDRRGRGRAGTPRRTRSRGRSRTSRPSSPKPADRHMPAGSPRAGSWR